MENLERVSDSKKSEKILLGGGDEYEEIIHICFALYDPTGNYSMYVGVAMASVFEHTKSKVCVHILHNPTLSEENKQRFKQLANKYGQNIKFYEIEQIPKQMVTLKSTKNFSEGALYRLQISELLPKSIKTIIYLDADIVVNIDINEMLNEMDYGKSIAVVQNYSRSYSNKVNKLLAKEGLNNDEYFNSGVMIWNLEKIRLGNLSNYVMDFLERFPDTPFFDQDALNFIFKDDKKLLPKYYNIATRAHRDDEDLRSGVYHFVGDYIRPNAKTPFEKLFFDMLMKTPWGDNVSIQKYYVDEYEKLIASKKEWQTFCRYSRNKRLAVWGINSRFFGALSDMIAFDPDVDCAFDNDTTSHNEIRFGLKVHSPSILENEHSGKFYILVLSNLYYGEIKKQLESYGLRDKKDFIDARLLIGDMKFHA